jgi:hypothetical protein
MSFWQTSDNERLQTTGEYDAGGNMEPIPANTQVLAAPDEAKWDEYDGVEYVSIRWNVLAPKEYANRKISQKLKVYEPDAKKADKAKRMLAAIDANAGGKLLQSGQVPSDLDLTRNLVNKPMMLLLQVWAIEKEADGTPIPKADQKRGNWVAKVAPRNAAKAPAPASAPAPAGEAHSPAPKPADDQFDDDIPF